MLMLPQKKTWQKVAIQIWEPSETVDSCRLRESQWEGLHPMLMAHSDGGSDDGVHWEIHTLHVHVNQKCAFAT